MKNFINISDCSSVELRAIIEEAKKRKQNRSGLNKSAPDEDKPFEGKSMAMIFEKPSTRTRMSFDIAVKQLGGSSIILNPDGIHYGKGEESLKDTAIFDTNINQHHHFLNEETGELIDIENDEVNLHKLPKIPQGYINNGVEVLIKIKKQI